MSEADITPEMIKAGAKVCAEVYGVCSEFVGEGLAEDVFAAMMAIQPDSTTVTTDAERTRRNS
jgi:hypothetical protein